MADFVRWEKVFLSFQKPWMRCQRNSQFQSRHDCDVLDCERRGPLQLQPQPLPLCQSVGFGDELR